MSDAWLIRCEIPDLPPFRVKMTRFLDRAQTQLGCGQRQRRLLPEDLTLHLIDWDAPDELHAQRVAQQVSGMLLAVRLRWRPYADGVHVGLYLIDPTGQRQVVPTPERVSRSMREQLYPR